MSRPTSSGIVADLEILPFLPGLPGSEAPPSLISDDILRRRSGPLEPRRGNLTLRRDMTSGTNAIYAMESKATGGCHEARGLEIEETDGEREGEKVVGTRQISCEVATGKRVGEGEGKERDEDGEYWYLKAPVEDQQLERNPAGRGIGSAEEGEGRDGRDKVSALYVRCCFTKDHH